MPEGIEVNAYTSKDMRMNTCRQAQQNTTPVLLRLPQIIQKAPVQRQHVHMVPLEACIVLLRVVRSTLQTPFHSAQGMGHVHSIALRENAELVAQVAQMLDPLHLVETVVDEAFVEARQVLRALHHHVGLEEALLEAGHARVLDVGAEGGPLLGQVVLCVRRASEANVRERERAEDGAAGGAQTADHVALGLGVVLHDARREAARQQTQLDAGL